MLLAEQLVGEARERRARRMESRERLATSVSAACFLLAAVAIALLIPNERQVDPIVTIGLVAGYAALVRVRFEFGWGYTSAEQLAYIPLLLLGPLPLVPLLVALAGVLSMVPDAKEGNWARDRFLTNFTDAWWSLGGTLTLAALAPGAFHMDHVSIYLLALAAHFCADLLWTLIRDVLVDETGNVRATVRLYAGSMRVDAILTPIAFLTAWAGSHEPIALLASAPLAWLMHLFSEDRKDRYSKTLELHRAYRGTVMLLSEVVEYDDPYTAHHSRSIVELVDAVADDLGVPQAERPNLEFAALLHDVGKIAIPKDILNKPGPLNRDEFEVMKTHTIEGQFMLDRVGGRLGDVGEIVRSCHERFDGKGYPDGLAGDQIPLTARIIFTCDAFSAMTQDRVYRARMSDEEALLEISTNAGGQFDPMVAASLAKVVQENKPEISAVEQLRPVVQAATALHRRVGTGAA